MVTKIKICTVSLWNLGISDQDGTAGLVGYTSYKSRIEYSARPFNETTKSRSNDTLELVLHPFVGSKHL